MVQPRGARWWRWAAGAAIAALMLGCGLLAIPHYRRNAEFERALERIVRRADSAEVAAEVLLSRVEDRTARLGLPVRAGQVHVRRTGRGVRLEVRYAVPVDLAVCTVDLHFRARAEN